ncbi:MAG: hypothetical protein WBD34_11665 [Burkholderiaceae bacterium]
MSKKPRQLIAALHSMDTIDNAIGLLQLPYVLNNGCNLRFGDLWLGRHVAELPVVLFYTLAHGVLKRGIRMMPRIVIVMQ